jgi:hypothetical protein
MRNYEEMCKEVFPVKQRVLSGKGSKEDGKIFLEFLESPEHKEQQRIDLEDFMAHHKNFDYNAFTAHLVG